MSAGKSIGELSLEEFKSFSPAFEEDVYDAVSMKTCVEKRLTLGAPGRAGHGAGHCPEPELSAGK